MDKTELTCIGCPMGCSLTVTRADGQLVVSGNTCPRGADYAKKELTDPRRIVTSTVRVTGGELPVVSVKTASDIPKGKIMDCMRALQTVALAAPVHAGDVVLSDAAGTGIDVIATKTVERLQETA